jgi:Cupin
MICIDVSISPHMDWINSMLRFIAAEAEQLRPGGEAVITRLADILVVQTIRAWIERDPAAQTGWLGALQDNRVYSRPVRRSFVVMGSLGHGRAKADQFAVRFSLAISSVDTQRLAQGAAEDIRIFRTSLLTPNYSPQRQQRVFIIGHFDPYRYGWFIDFKRLGRRNARGRVYRGIVSVFGSIVGNAGVPGGRKGGFGAQIDHADSDKITVPVL